MKSVRIQRLFYTLVALLLVLPQSAGAATIRATSEQAPRLRNTLNQLDQVIPNPGTRKGEKGGEEEDPDRPLQRAEWFYGLRTAGDPSITFTLEQAAQLRDKAAQQVLSEQPSQPSNPQAYGGAWQPFGPDPIVQASRSAPQWLAMAGRIGALDISPTAPYTLYLGAANGGVWISSTLTGGWIPKTDRQSSLAVGALAVAPSDPQVIYVGTGEGALSGDSYFGNGVLKSTDGGNSFQHVGGDTFNQVSISKIVVDPDDADHVYLTTLAGIAGVRRARPPFPTPYGVFESKDGGNSWTGLLVTANRLEGAVDLALDPVNKDLYASFWSRGIVKSTDGGQTWQPAMNGLPVAGVDADYTVAPTRMAIGLSHPPTATEATLYTGFEWYDVNFNYHPSVVYKSTDGAANWALLPGPVGYCGSSPSSTQCWYDNVIGVDPNNPDIVFALGLFNYGTGTGGVYRSLDGGATWKDMGYNQHPDFHAIAISKTNPGMTVIGNDGGVWSSPDWGGRLGDTDPKSAVDWKNLNGLVTTDNQGNLVVQGYGLQIAQFTSVGQNPSDSGHGYGGTQDNGTLHKYPGSMEWYDFSSGDGGQVLVDWLNPLTVYGTYYNISPYRFDEGMNTPFANLSIANGINTSDRSAFYIPFIYDPTYTSRLYLGTYRVYRSDNKGDKWKSISDDLTTGCTSSGASPTTYPCVITALGANYGSPALYVGTGDGKVWLSPNADLESPLALPDWIDLTPAGTNLPLRPVDAIAVDPSDYRVAYIAYSGFNAATPFSPGHIFKTTDAGNTWTDISGDLPDIPVNTLALDYNDPQTIYAGTDVGPMVTYNGGANWTELGSDHPLVPVHALDLNPYTGQLLSGTHGRGAWVLENNQKAPALVIRKFVPTAPRGPNQEFNYDIVVQNRGNAMATGTVVTDTLPAGVTYVSSSPEATVNGDNISWDVGTVPTGTTETEHGGLIPAAITVTLTVRVNPDLVPGDTITNDDWGLSADGGINIQGSPTPLTLAPERQPLILPLTQWDGANPGKNITYTETVQNVSFISNTFDLSVTGNQWPTTLWNADLSSQISQTVNLMPSEAMKVVVQVHVPLTATGGSQDTATIVAASTVSPTIAAEAKITTVAVTAPILVVDQDQGNPDVQDAYFAALQAADFTQGSYDVWDLSNPPLGLEMPVNYMKAHKAIVWFTGSSWPDPITPYEDRLAAFLDAGGRLFMSGMDILDQAGGTTDFVKNYLHIDWKGDESQNDIGYAQVTGVPTNTVTAGLGPYDLHMADLGYCDCQDEITPIGPAQAAFVDENGQPTGLTVEAGNYKVAFLAFPLEAMGTANDQSDVMSRVMAYFGVRPGMLMIGRLFHPIMTNNAGGTTP